MKFNKPTIHAQSFKYYFKLSVFSSLIVLSTGSIVFAEEEVGIKVDKINTSSDTTISIKKGSSQSNQKKWILTEGEEDITGDKDVVLKSAEKNWKKACKEWKIEFKELNKDNKIISLNCGKMNCSKEGVESTCTSKAIHKVKTLTEE